MDTSFKTFLGILVFYAFLSYVLFPLAFYYGIEKSLSSAGRGFIVGSLLSIVLWVTYGKKMVK